MGLVATFAMSAAADTPCQDPDYQHGISYVLPLKYGSGFQHFDYANPDAPKAGPLRLPDMGTFDSFNNILEKGRIAAGADFGGSRNLMFETLLEPAADEPASAYGRLAEGVHVDDDYRWVAFKLRDEARWHDGEPLGVDDVVFSFEAFKQHGSVALKTALTDLDRVGDHRRTRGLLRHAARRRDQPHHAVRIRRDADSGRALLGREGTFPGRPPRLP